MKHRYRFFIPPTDLQPAKVDRTCLIEGSEFNHLHKVLRLPVGSEVDLVDGLGTVAAARISGFAGHQARLTLLSYHTFAPPGAPLSAAVGALKPGLIDELLPSLTELGCDHLHVFLQEKTAKHRIQAKALARWHSIIQGASKQCKRAFFPTLSVWPHLDAFLGFSSKQNWDRIYVQPGAAQALIDLSPPPPQGRCFLVGAERGLDSAEEARLHDGGFTAAHLGPLILRAYTAILATAAILGAKRLANHSFST